MDGKELLNQATEKQGVPTGGQSTLSQNLNTLGGELGNNSQYFEEMDAPEDAQVGEKVAPGKEVGEDGKVRNSAVREGLEAGVNVGGLLLGGSGNVAKEAGKQTAKEAGKQTAKEAAKETAKEAGKETAKEAGKQTAKGFGAGDRNLLGGSNGPSKGFNNMPGNNTGNNPQAKELIQKASGLIDNAAGRVADELEKVPGVKEKAEEYREGFKGINDTFDAFGKLTQGDIKGASGKLKSAKKNLVKQRNKEIKKMLLKYVLPPVLGFGLFLLIVILPVFGGFVNETAFDGGSISSAGTQNAWVAIIGANGNNNEAARAVIGNVPGFENLPLLRKAIIVSAAVAIGTPYSSGTRPTSATLEGISGGVDSGSFLEWLIWNITGNDPGYLPGSSLASNRNFQEISESELVPGDIGTNGDDIGLYMGNNEWIFVDSSQGVIRGAYSGFTHFYQYSGINNSGGPGSGGGGVGDYDPCEAVEGACDEVEGPSGEFRDRLIYWAQVLHQKQIPYNNCYNGNVSYNKASSLNINGNNFWTPILSSAQGTVCGGGKQSLPLDFNTVNYRNLKGLDCAGYVSYVYLLATNGIYRNYVWSLASSGSAAGFTEVSKSQVKKGDVAVMPGSHVMLVDHIEPDGSAYVYEMSGCTKPTYTINGRQLKYGGSTNVGTSCNGTTCKRDGACRYFTYTGDEGNDSTASVNENRANSITYSQNEITSADSDVYNSNIDNIGIDSDASDKVTRVLNLAQQAVDIKIPYEYGGKPSQTGFDPSWGSPLTYNMNKGYYNYNLGKKHYYHGLDCSGFISWLTWTAIGQRVNGSANDMMTNSSISTPISASELRPGDLGFSLKENGQAGHVGIYAGNGIWYHQGSGGSYASITINGQVSMSKGYTKKEPNSSFTRYSRLKVLS